MKPIIGCPAGSYIDDRNQICIIQAPKPRTPELEVIPRQRCTTHREKVHVFTDGSVMKCCTHDECGWGKNKKTHSDRQDYSLDSVEDMPIVELSPDGEGVIEVQLSTDRNLIAGVETEDEITPDQYELAAQQELEQAAEEQRLAEESENRRLAGYEDDYEDAA